MVGIGLFRTSLKCSTHLAFFSPSEKGATFFTGIDIFGLDPGSSLAVL